MAIQGLLRKSAKIAIVSGVIIAVAVSVLAVTIHLRLSAIEGKEGNTNESTSQKISEIVGNITNPNAKENRTSNSEANESPEQRASEGH